MNYPLAIDPTSTEAWKKLSELRTQVPSISTRLDNESAQGTDYCVTATALSLDFNRQRISANVLNALYELAQETGVLKYRDAMFSGLHINVTEDRAVAHMALRVPDDEKFFVDGIDVSVDVHKVLNRMYSFAKEIEDGTWRGATGKQIDTIVNIGIGGSDLGPAMSYLALADYRQKNIKCFFVSNVDPFDIQSVLSMLLPESTLFVVSSKTFTTAETMANANLARNWIIDKLGKDSIAKHFVAVSTNIAKAKEFGIAEESIFGFWDWVGGRYSMTSAIGLSTLLAIGKENFKQLLAGFHSMDEHFKTAKPADNIPLIMGLLSVWNRNFLNIPTTAVLPYAQQLSRFPAYLQQLTMESNGKSVRRNGEPVSYETGAIFWGEPGTNGQHSFYQLLHQGTSAITCDLVIIAKDKFASSPVQVMSHKMLVANAIAQAAVLSLGRSVAALEMAGEKESLIPHKLMPGNRPVSLLLMQELTPFSVGELIAAYEHSVFVQGAIWGLNSFDQWGVELGKSLALGVQKKFDGADSSYQPDAATARTIDWYLKNK